MSGMSESIDLGGELFHERLRRLAGGRRPADIARESSGRLALQTVWQHYENARDIRMGMENEKFQAYVDILGDDPVELWLSIGRSTGKSLIRKSSLLEAELPPGLERLDSQPHLRVAIINLLRSLVDMAPGGPPLRVVVE